MQRNTQAVSKLLKISQSLPINFYFEASFNWHVELLNSTSHTAGCVLKVI